MEEIGIYEARNAFSQLIQRVQNGEAFVITNHGKEMAVLMSPDEQKRALRKEQMETLRRAFQEHTPPSLEEMMHWSKEGQR